MAEKKEKYIPRYKIIFNEEVLPRLKEKFGYENDHRVPRLEKIVVNVGIGEAARNSKLLESVMADLLTITAQKPKVCLAKKSISNFKLRVGMPIGAKVTLRGARMWDFFDRLVNIAMPRIRDFRGANPDSFDGHGNYNIGIEEQIIFPEIDYDKVDAIRGMNITFVTTVDTDEEGFELLKELGFPFRSKD
ncbi:50S ribosomal protein L5 [bacterium]|nr:MAG: 50S ribosomal protein L5 [bacterium]